MLGLETPLVAVLWQRMLAHAHGIRLTPMLDAGLALACWVVCVAGRMLDAFSAKTAARPDPRHAFDHRHRCVVLLAVVPAALLALAWMALYVIPEGVMWQALGLSLLVMLHLATWPDQGGRVPRDFFIACAGLGGILLISRMPPPAGYRFVLSLILLGAMALSLLRQIDIRLGRWLPEEFTAALIFALGCGTSTRFLGMPETIRDPVLECLLLTMLLACHLHGITGREKNTDRGHAPLMFGAAVFALAVRWLAEGGVLEHALRGPAQAVLGALALHMLVENTSPPTHVACWRIWRSSCPCRSPGCELRET